MIPVPRLFVLTTRMAGERINDAAVSEFCSHLKVALALVTDCRHHEPDAVDDDHVRGRRPPRGPTTELDRTGTSNVTDGLSRDQTTQYKYAQP